VIAVNDRETDDHGHGCGSPRRARGRVQLDRIEGVIAVVREGCQSPTMFPILGYIICLIGRYSRLSC
jgi:hypothetical protein